MSRYQAETSRREILCKLYDSSGVDYEHPGLYRLEVENQRDSSREARKFLSLSVERQEQVVDDYYPSRSFTKEETEELTRAV